MRVFLSHASKDRDAAEQIYLTLINARHDVFFDRSAVQGGDNFNTRIQKCIKKCELLIFLISPDSVARSSYALTELKFAREKWPHPQGHVLPVIIRQTSYDLIPQYLKAVSILEPEGNAAAEVGEQVIGWKKRHGRSLKHPFVIIPTALLVSSFIAFLFWYYWNHPVVRVISPPSSQNTNSESLPSPTPITNNAGADPAHSLTSSNSNNIRKVQTSIPAQVTTNVNNNQASAATPNPVTFVLSSRVFDGENPVKGARISLVDLPEQGTVETDDNGAFVLKGVHKKINDKVEIRVEHEGFKTEVVEITIGKHLPLIYLEKLK